MHCSTCLPKYIACTSGGLTSIPIQFQPGTEKIILSGQLQFNGILSPSNFSELAPPKYHIHTLSIRSSSIQELSSNTFSRLTFLKYLDLSENQRLTIMSSTFYGLQLKILKLDDIGKLMLSQGAFNGLSTDSLSMKNSRLQSLNFDIFSPISHTLKNLYIENNQIRTLDQKFEPLFYRLESVNLKDNPLICYCPLLWLSKALRSKMLNNRFSNRFSDAKSDASTETNSFPKCVAPSYLRNRQLQSISEAEFNCQVPQIAQVEIDLMSLFGGIMSCSIKPEEKGHKIPTKIFWQKENAENGIGYQRFVEKTQNTGDRLVSDNNGVGDLSSTIKFSSERNKNRENFQCIAENTAGRSLVAVQISWPKMNNSLEIPRNSMTTESETRLSSNNNHNQWNPVNHKSYFFTKQYTLLEMTAAIAGTFMITVVIFLIFYKLYFRKRHGYKCGKPSLKYSIAADLAGSNKRSLMAFHSPRGGYTVYETSMHYSDNSQTYDSIPHNAVYPQQQQPLFSTISNSPSAHFIDYKTHKNLYPSPPSN